MPELFTLSILQPYVQMILSGRKRWEFRASPTFGRTGGHELAADDIVFIVAVGPAPIIPCFFRVGRILRGEELRAYFGDPATGHWLEAGCSEGTDRDWTFFEREILRHYETAIELAVTSLDPPVPADVIRDVRSGEPWSGRGFCHVSQLHRYTTTGISVAEFFQKATTTDSTKGG